MVDAIIIGGGLAGCALAHFCATRGLETVLLEAESVGGSGATKHSRGIVRVYDPNPELMRWSLSGFEEWSNWVLTEASPFTACGVLYVVSAINTEKAKEALRDHDHGRYPIHMMSRRALVKEAPQFRHLADENDVVLFEPHGGYVDPRLAARLYAQSAVSLGAAVIEGSTANGIDSNERYAVVRTAEGELRARLAVVAAGAASPLLVPGLSVFTRSIPLSCLFADRDAPRQCVIDEKTGGYLRPDQGGFFFCGGAPQEDADSPAALSPRSAESGASNFALSQHLLNSNGQMLIDTRLGFDGYTPDFLPILGPASGDSRLVLLTGFSGRGVKYIPAVARALSGDIAERLERMQ